MSGLGQGFGQIIPPVKKGLDSPPARGMTGEGIDFLVKQGNDGGGAGFPGFPKGLQPISLFAEAIPDSGQQRARSG